MFIFNMSGKNRKLGVLAVLMLIITIIISINYYKALKIENFNKFVYDIPSSGDIQLTDTYDSKYSSIYDFFSKKDSLKIMNKTYHQLTKNTRIDYYELQLQSIDLIGDYNITKEFTIGEDSSQIRQKNYKGEEITPVKSVQISTKCLQKFKLTKSGQVLERWDSSSEDIVPVFIGHEFTNIMKIGDIFPAYYLGDKKLNFMIIDVLPPNSYIEINNEKINLDRYIVMPSINYAKNDTDDFKKTLMSVKCEGFIHYETLSEYKRALKELEKIRNNTGFKYDLPQGKKELNTLFGLDSRVYGFCLIIIMILLIIIIYYFSKNVYKRIK